MKPALYLVILTLYDIAILGASSFSLAEILVPILAFFLVATNKKRLIFWLFGLNLFIIFVAVSYILNGDFSSAKVVFIRSNLILLLTLSLFMNRGEWFLLKGFYTLKFPKKFIVILFVALNLINSLLKKALKIPKILKIRGVDGGLNFYKAYAGALARLVSDFLDKSYSIYKTMKIRGFNGELGFLRSAEKLRIWDFLILVLVIFIVILRSVNWLF